MTDLAGTMSLFSDDKLLGYSLMGVISQCFNIKKQNWEAMFKDLNQPFEAKLYEQYSSKQYLSALQSRLDSTTVQVTKPVAIEPKEAPAKVEKAEPAEVDFSAFF